MKQLESALEGKKVRFLDLKYCDLTGRLRHVTLPIERLADAASKGVGFDSSSVAGFGKVEGSDMVLRPDIETAFIDPFAAQPTVSCFANIYHPANDQRYERDPRFILQKALAAIRGLTQADDVMVLPEFEFYLFNSVEFHTDDSSSTYRIVTDELRHDDHTGVALYKGPAYHVAPPYDRSSDFRSELSELMEGCGIPVKYHHHEGGRFSQVEVEPRYMPGARAADAIVLTKYLVRNLAFKTSRSATFMPKPIYGEPGSGMHLHTYLVKNGASLMGDEHSPTRLSAIGRHYVGGILEHAPSLCALTNPSTNSYRRLIPGFEAPVLVFFSLGNRTAAIRIPGYITSAKDMAVEYRIPDATANPYLALAAVLMAALDGLRRKVDPGAPMKGRLEGRETELEAHEPGAGPRALPTSLGQALRELKQDCGYLKHDGVFPASLLDKWVELKAVEADAVMKRPHPWEFSLYYGS